MTIDLDLCYRGAASLVADLHARKLSPVELMRNTLARIDQVNPTLNCFCFVYPDEALEKAKAAEARLMRGGELPPLLGLPVAFKDLTPTKGKRTTLGSRAFEQWVPDHSATVVERLEAAGAIVVGKTTTPEFAYSGFTESPLWGITRNPWNPERTPGGSSGGSGAAVASGCVTLAEGTDMGGSVRIPAGFCGVVGLKPSHGRIPMDILPSQQDLLSHFGPLARSVEDAALFMQYAHGPDDRDLISLPGKLDFGQLSRDAKGLRLAVTDDQNIYAVSPAVRERFRAGVEALRAAGAEIEEVALPTWSRALVDRWYDLWKLFMAAYFGHLLAEWRDRMDPNIVALIEGGNKLSAVEVKRIELLTASLWDSLRPILSRCHALLSPTNAITAPPVGQRDADYMAPDGRLGGPDMCTVYNLIARCPALSVPCGVASDGLPVGMQILARRHDDLLALRIGAVLEDSLGTFQRPPELAGYSR